MTTYLYECFAEILDYPQSNIRERIENCIREVQDQYSDVEKYITEFAQFVQSVELEKLQEVYTATFDLNPVCTLDIGYHVFGESYKRGTFLSGMQGMIREHGLGPITELPDHLTVILRLLARMEHDEDYDALIEFILSPSLGKMEKLFDTSTNVYRNVLKALTIIIQREHNLPEKEGQEDISEKSREFLGCKADLTAQRFNQQCPAGTGGLFGCSPIEGIKK